MKNQPPDTRVKVYSGKDPFVFVSYAHADRDKVLPVLRLMQESRLRIWYDEGIKVGTEWPETVASHLLNSHTVVFFLSKSFFKSQNCAREAHYAVSKRKQMICVLLDDTEQPADLQMQFSVAEHIDCRAGDFAMVSQSLEHLLGADYIGDGVTGYETFAERKKPVYAWRAAAIILAVLLLIGAAAVLGYFNGWFSTAGVMVETVSNNTEESLILTEFKDSYSRDILLKSFSGSALYLCGNVMVSREDAILYTDKTWLVNGQVSEPGSLDNCGMFADNKDIKYLALVNENLSDLSELSTMSQLVYLDISGNPIKDLSFLQNLSNLQILKLIDVEGADYSVLPKLENLECLYISLDQLEVVRKIVDLSTIDVIVK